MVGDIKYLHVFTHVLGGCGSLIRNCVGVGETSGNYDVAGDIVISCSGRGKYKQCREQKSCDKYCSELFHGI